MICYEDLTVAFYSEDQEELEVKSARTCLRKWVGGFGKNVTAGRAYIANEDYRVRIFPCSQQTAALVNDDYVAFCKSRPDDLDEAEATEPLVKVSVSEPSLDKGITLMDLDDPDPASTLPQSENKAGPSVQDPQRSSLGAVSVCPKVKKIEKIKVKKERKDSSVVPKSTPISDPVSVPVNEQSPQPLPTPVQPFVVPLPSMPTQLSTSPTPAPITAEYLEAAMRRVLQESSN